MTLVREQIEGAIDQSILASHETEKPRILPPSIESVELLPEVVFKKTRAIFGDIYFANGQVTQRTGFVLRAFQQFHQAIQEDRPFYPSTDFEDIPVKNPSVLLDSMRSVLKENKYQMENIRWGRTSAYIAVPKGTKPEEIQHIKEQLEQRAHPSPSSEDGENVYPDYEVVSPTQPLSIPDSAQDFFVADFMMNLEPATLSLAQPKRAETPPKQELKEMKPNDVPAAQLPHVIFLNGNVATVTEVKQHETPLTPYSRSRYDVTREIPQSLRRRKWDHRTGPNPAVTKISGKQEPETRDKQTQSNGTGAAATPEIIGTEKIDYRGPFTPDQLWTFTRTVSALWGRSPHYKNDKNRLYEEMRVELSDQEIIVYQDYTKSFTPERSSNPADPWAKFKEDFRGFIDTLQKQEIDLSKEPEATNQMSLVVPILRQFERHSLFDDPYKLLRKMVETFILS